MPAAGCANAKLSDELQLAVIYTYRRLSKGTIQTRYQDYIINCVFFVTFFYIFGIMRKIRKMLRNINNVNISKQVGNMPLIYVRLKFTRD